MNKIWAAVIVLAGALVGVAAARPSQGPEIKHVMRQKLEHTQKILEAVVTSDWVGLETESRELERLTMDSRWSVLNYPEVRNAPRRIRASRSRSPSRGCAA